MRAARPSDRQATPTSRSKRCTLQRLQCAAANAQRHLGTPQKHKAKYGYYPINTTNQAFNGEPPAPAAHLIAGTSLCNACTAWGPSPDTALRPA